MTSLSEMVLAVTLARAVDGLEEGRWVADDTIGYSRTSSGNQIDFSPVRVPTEAGSDLTSRSNRNGRITAGAGKRSSFIANLGRLF
jgi:hypothetical protein